MISISKKKVSLLNKIVLLLLVIYSLSYLSYKVYNYYEIYYKKEGLLKELDIKKNETEVLKNRVSLYKKKILELEEQYITKDELETKVKSIFERMSLLDYQINYLGTKKMCIDRYLLITNIYAQSEEGLKAAEGILSYLGKIRKSDDFESIYFIDYIATPKRIQ